MKNMKRKLSLLLLALFCLTLAAFPMMSVSATEGVTYVYDMSGVLSDSERAALQSHAESVADAWQYGVYIVLVNDYREYASGSVADAAEAIYYANGFGLGSGQNGIMLLISFDGRDYYVKCYGSIPVSDYEVTRIENRFLDNFRDDDWYGGLSDYVAGSEEMLQRLQSGETGSRSLMESVGVLGGFALIVVLPCLIAFLACTSARMQLKSVAKATSARFFAVPNSLDLIQSSDIFTHITQTRVKVESDSSRDSSRSSGGGGGSSHHSGKF